MCESSCICFFPDCREREREQGRGGTGSLTMEILCHCVNDLRSRQSLKGE